MTDMKTRGWITLAMAVAQIVVPLALFSGGFVQATPELSEGVDYSAARPAGYAFSIWTPIFALALFTSVLMVRGATVGHAGLRRLGWYPALTYASGMMWMVAAVYGAGWTTIALIWVMLVFAGLALHRAVAASHPEGWWRFGVLPGLGLYAGWLSAAVWVNTAGIGPDYGLPVFGLGPQGFGVVILGAATAMAAALLRPMRANLAYVAALVWAFVAIIVENGFGTPVAWAAIAAILVLAGLTAMMRARAV